MNPPRLIRLLTPLLVLGLLLIARPAAAEPMALVGIAQGPVVLVRQTSRYTLVEGTPLADGDIVETAAGAFVQIEFDDGAIVALGEASRVLLKPRMPTPKDLPGPRLYLLEGWMKASPSPKAPGELSFLSPLFGLVASGGAVVVHVVPGTFDVFIEKGSGRLLQRDVDRAPIVMKGGDFARRAPTDDKPAVASRIAPDFLEKLPRPFRDPLPSRAAVVAKREVTLKAIGPVDYPDVRAWLHTEAALRIGLSKQWRSRASDRAFRAEVAANLSAHMEWERVLYPERFLPKKPPPPRPVPPPSAPAASEPGAS